MPGMPKLAGLRERAIGSLPVRRGKADVRQVSGALLPKSAPGTSARGDALRRPAHVVGASPFKSSSLAGRVEVCATKGQLNH